MTTINALSEVAALMGDPARASMLSLLMDGRAHTASELALTAGITAQTASGHLSRMVDGNLLSARAQGRNRFYRLASSDVAHAIESLMTIAGTRAPPASMAAAWRRDPDLRFCRTCYDHLAGQVGTAVTDALTRSGYIEPKGARDWTLTEPGELFCKRIGVDVPSFPGDPTPFPRVLPQEFAGAFDQKFWLPMILVVLMAVGLEQFYRRSMIGKLFIAVPFIDSYRPYASSR